MTDADAHDDAGAAADPWAALERRVAALEAERRAPEPHDHRDHGAPVPPSAAGATSEPATFWALEELKRQVATLGLAGGAVMFAGTARVAAGQAEWQETRVVADLLDDTSLDALEQPAAALAALGSPVRLLLLVRVLGGTEGSASAAELAADEGLGTSGQVYHHLRQLVSAGWLRSVARGRYAVPPERVVPLLVALALAGR